MYWLATPGGRMEVWHFLTRPRRNPLRDFITWVKSDRLYAVGYAGGLLAVILVLTLAYATRIGNREAKIDSLEDEMRQLQAVLELGQKRDNLAYRLGWHKGVIDCINSTYYPEAWEELLHANLELRARLLAEREAAGAGE
jgi:hypothetical protein